ncbi:hypothetical protein I5I80_28510, partial [Pseudomonas aeruginosa]|nr:hypothetical protein [Pseudomonas aeruginosa]
MTPRAGISGWCVRHPIATALLTLASLLLGLLALRRRGGAPVPAAAVPPIPLLGRLNRAQPPRPARGGGGGGGGGG